MLRYSIATTPLCTGLDGDGAAYFGVVFDWIPPDWELGLVPVELLWVLVGPVTVVVELPELLDPQPPASTTSAEQAIRADSPLWRIGRSFLGVAPGRSARVFVSLGFAA